MVMICAQLSNYYLTADQIAKWLRESKFNIEVKRVQVYKYWAMGKDTLLMGFWWVAEVDRLPVWVGQNLAKGNIRVYNKGNIHCSAGSKVSNLSYMTVRQMTKWPEHFYFRKYTAEYGFEWHNDRDLVPTPPQEINNIPIADTGTSITNCRPFPDENKIQQNARLLREPSLSSTVSNSSSRKWWSRDESDFILDSWGSTSSPEMKFPYEIKHDVKENDFAMQMNPLISRMEELKNDLIAMVEKYSN